MALKSCFLLLWCLGLSIYHVSATKSSSLFSEDSSDEDGGVIDAQYILDLANVSRDALTSLVGKIMKNLEKNLSDTIKKSGVDVFSEMLCQRSECSVWSDWTDCPGSEYGYSKAFRSRDCGRNNSHCSYPAYKYRTEQESRWCIGEQLQTPGQGENANLTTTTPATNETGTNDTMSDTNATMSNETTPDDSHSAAGGANSSIVYCPTNYEASRGLCLQLVVRFKLTYAMANQLCSWQQGHLINANTLKRQRSLYKLLQKHNHTQGVWIDGIADGIATFNNGGTPMIEYKDGSSRPAEETAQYYLGPDAGTIPEDLCQVDLGFVVQQLSLRPCSSTMAFVCQFASTGYAP